MDNLYFALTIPKTSSLDLVGYYDINYASSTDGRCSTCVYCIFLGESLMSWKSSKKKVMSCSIIKNVYHAMALACATLIWLQSLLVDLCISLPTAPILLTENVDTKALLTIMSSIHEQST